MARNLIGTGADQVSVNGMLGELAFQSKENVNFTGGTGKLSKLDIDAISAQLGVTAVDVFVYDTSKDSDGGAWRKRCVNASWYNETLNTDYRGSRREFPSVAVIVVTSYSLAIYDGDDPALPMWMVMASGVNTVLYTTLTSVCAVNGIVYVGTNPGSANYYDGGVKVINFASDSMRSYSYALSAKYNYNIAQRNVNWTGLSMNPHYYSVDIGILPSNPNVNDVAAAVLPGAPIDVASGLPVPTVAVAQSSGITIIKNDGTTITSGNINAIAKVDFYNNDLYSVLSTYDNMRINTRFSYNGSGFMADYDLYYGNGLGTATTNAKSHISGSGYNGTAVAGPAFGNSQGISLFSHSTPNVAVSSTMVDYITTKYNTGWMLGDIKGAWLSDTTQETVVATNYVTNGTFDTNTSGWTADGATISVSGGQLVITNSGVGNGEAYQAVSGLIVGKPYIFSVGITTGTSSGSWYISNTAPNAYTGDYGYEAGAGVTGTRSQVFYPTQSTVYIRLENYSNTSSGAYSYYDNVSIRPADIDRSINGKGLQVYGSITKTPVASGADLVAYSGFSASNYIEQPYNSALDFGTGDFCIMGWVKISALNTVETFFHRKSSTASGAEILLRKETTNLFRLYLNDGVGKVIDPTVTQAAITGTWQHYCAVKSGITGSLYLNGVLVGSTSTIGVGTFTNVGAVTALGHRCSVDANATAEYAGNTSMALWKISAGAPTVDQIVKIYNDEKMLFQDNAKATLYGTSDSITALAYDADTKLLHAGTSSGRSVFQGIRRIDNTTTAVSASISAANGLVAEQ